jgi:hypothetical protein
MLNFFKKDSKEAKNNTHKDSSFLYSSAEMETIETHLTQYFGEVKSYYHELVSPDIHCDIAVIPPEDGRDFYTLCTVGAGAYRMDVPEERREKVPRRAEYMILLPADWNFSDLDDERNYWVFRLLKSTARLPINCQT